MLETFTSVYEWQGRYLKFARSLSDLGVRHEGKTGLSPKKRNFEANSGSL